jgi:hypothetical protein
LASLHLPGKRGGFSGVNAYLTSPNEAKTPAEEIMNSNKKMNRLRKSYLKFKRISRPIFD